MAQAKHELTHREREILHSVVRAYIDDGEPVGSRTISRFPHFNLSPATIRNVMADLADQGYLAQPHTSAGRIPTERAFRDFVAGLPSKPLPFADRERITNQLGSAASIEQRVEAASKILTDLTRNVGIAAALPSTSQQLEHVELIALPDSRVLIIVATSDKMVRNRVVTLDQALTQDDLTGLRNYININFSGWTLERARAEMLRRIEQEKVLYDAMLQKLNLLYQKGLLVTETGPQISMDGTSWLVGLDLHLTRERMRDLFRALEEKHRVLALLDRFMESSGHGEVAVHVGLEEAHPSMRELALIGITVDLPNGFRTRVAVLGPVRMQYEKVISSVLQIGRTFETIL